jgi:hypothetical protein
MPSWRGGAGSPAGCLCCRPAIQLSGYPAIWLAVGRAGWLRGVQPSRRACQASASELDTLHDRGPSHVVDVDPRQHLQLRHRADAAQRRQQSAPYRVEGRGHARGKPRRLHQDAHALKAPAEVATGDRAQPSRRLAGELDLQREAPTVARHEHGIRPAAPGRRVHAVARRPIAGFRPAALVPCGDAPMWTNFSGRRSPGARL